MIISSFGLKFQKYLQKIFKSQRNLSYHENILILFQMSSGRENHNKRNSTPNKNCARQEI